MPLSSLNLMQIPMQQASQAANRPLPLDVLEARRAAKEQEQLARSKADSERAKVNEYSAAGQNKRNTQARTEQVMQEAKGMMTAQDVKDPNFSTEAKQVIQHLMNSGDPGAIKAATEMAPIIEKFMESEKTDPSTMKGELTQSIIEKNKRSPAGSGTTPKYPDVQAQVKSENDLFTYANRNMASSFPNVKMVANDDGAMVPEKLNPASFNFMQETFKNHLQQMTKGMPTNQIPRDAVKNAWDTVRDRYMVIDYDPWGPGDEQVLVPKIVYNRIKQDLPSATDVEIAAAYLEELGTR